MVEKGPVLTSCVIFYLSIGAAIFQILEEPNWMSARDRYILQKENVLKKFTCLTKEDLEEILEIVSEAAGQGVTITGDKHRNTWDWVNSVVFAASIVTTIGYGNVAPKTQGGRVFCILYGLCGIPLCLVWISELGSFFGDRARRLSGVLMSKGLSARKVQWICTALFLSWGLIVHLLIPPFVFMSVEGWTYLEGIYFSFITLTTVGFGDYVAGVNPNIEYPRLYRTFAEIWIYMGLAWLSLFFSWNVHMVVEAHRKLRLRRRREKNPEKKEPQKVEEKQSPRIQQRVIDIFKFLSEEDHDEYSTVIKEIGMAAKSKSNEDKVNRSKSCSDILAIQTLDKSPRRKPMSISQVFMSTKADVLKEDELPPNERSRDAEAPQHAKAAGQEENKDSCVFEPENHGIVFTVPARDTAGETVKHPDGSGSRFKICKVKEDSISDKDEKG